MNKKHNMDEGIKNKEDNRFPMLDEDDSNASIEEMKNDVERYNTELTKELMDLMEEMMFVERIENKVLVNQLNDLEYHQNQLYEE